MKLLERNITAIDPEPEFQEFNPLQLLNLLHSAPPERLGETLSAMLARPADHMSGLALAIPELCLLLSQLVMAQDTHGTTALCQALDQALAPLDCQPDSETFIGAALAPAQSRQLAWLLGRLESTLIFARRVRLLELPPSLQEELQDGGRSRALLRLLAEHGAMTLRNIVHQRSLTGEEDTPERVRVVMNPLVKAGMVELQQRSGRNEYRLSPLGVRVLEERPVWLDAVERAYRAWRVGNAGLPVPFMEALVHVFQSVDASLGAAAASGTVSGTVSGTASGTARDC